MRLKMGKCEMELGGSHLVQLHDCNDSLDDRSALHRRMSEDGYLLIRGLHERQDVLRARRVFINNLEEKGKIAPGTDPMLGIAAQGQQGGFHGGRKAISHHPDVLNVLEGRRVMGFFSFFFDEPVRSFDYKWLRAVSPGASTGAHYDVVYMGRGTTGKLYSVWTPMGDITYDLGPLALCLGSHNLPGFEKLRQTYGKMDVDRDLVEGWFSDDPLEIVEKFGGRWGTTEFTAGDALIFTMYTMHGSITNTSNRFRISTDTRYQPASAPVDERWIGDNPSAHYAWMADPTKSVAMEDARAKWGV